MQRFGSSRDSSPTAQRDCHLRVVRPKRGASDFFRAYHVIVDGEDVGQVKRGEVRLFWISRGRHEVHLVIDWCGSPSVSIEVAPGETAELICWPRVQWRQAMRALANRNEWIALTHGASLDGVVGSKQPSGTGDPTG